MPTYIGKVQFNGNSGMSSDDQLAMGRLVRSLVDIHGGRILSIYWIEDSDADMLITFEGRNKNQAVTVFEDLEARGNVRISVILALTEGEKQRAMQNASQ